MRIERIEKSKHKQERVLVFLEGGDLLRITGVELLRFGLHKDMELPEELVEELRRSAERSETKARAARLASSRMLSKKELSDRLVKKGTERGEAEELADWLEDLGAGDDAAYAGVIARHYGTMGYGPARGIGRDLWEDALAQLPPAEEAIEQFLRAKCKSGAPDRAACKRLSDALLRRGFSWQDIRPALSRLGEELPED